MTKPGNVGVVLMKNPFILTCVFGMHKSPLVL